MNYDCGMLKPSRTGKYIAATWSSSDLPPDIQHEVYVLVNTPGFTLNYLSRMLGVGRWWLREARRASDNDHYHSLGVDNYNSITRAEALQLCHARARTRATIPLTCNVYMLDDVARGQSTGKVSREWHVRPATIDRLRAFGPFYSSRIIPEWFAKSVGV